MAEAARPSPVEWHSLPDHVVERILLFLDWEDQYSLSLVCESWHKEFHSSIYGKKLKFTIGVDALNTNDCPLIETAKVYADRIKILEIEPPKGTMTVSLINRWVDWLQIFLKHLEQSQLEKMNFKCLSRICYDDASKDTLHRSIVELLRPQRMVDLLEMNHCFYAYKDILAIVSALIENSREIKGVVLEPCSKISEKPCDVPDRNQILFLLLKRAKLIALAIDYSLVLGNNAFPPRILEYITSSERLHCLVIMLSLSSFSVDFKRFETHQWRQLRNKPHLKTELHLKTTSRDFSQIASLIVRETPLTRVSYTFFEDSSHSNPEDFLNLLVSCNINENLERMDLKLANSHVPNLYALCIPFLNVCPKLNNFRLYTEYPARYLDPLLNALLVTPLASLTRIYLQIAGIKERRSLQHLELLIFEYKQRFISINVNLRADLFI